MPFSSISSLPPQVRSSLSDADQSKFREVFNSALEQYGDEETAFRVAWSAVKKSEDCRSFGGWISVEKVDAQGDKVNIDSLFEAIKKYISRGGPIMDEHTNRPVGTMYDAQIAEYSPKVKGVYGYGAVFQGERLYDGVWEKIKGDKLSGLSIGGDAVEERTVCDSKKCWNEISKMHIFEVSACKSPANHDSLIMDVNEKAKSEVKKVDCNNECMKRHQNDDGTFKGGFDGCVKAFQECCSDVSDASALCAQIGREAGKIPKGTLGQIKDYLTKHPDGFELISKCPHCKEIFDSLMKANMTEAVAKDATLALVKTMVKDETKPDEKEKESLPTQDQPKASILEELSMRILSLLTDVHKEIVMRKETPVVEEKPPEQPPEEKPKEPVVGQEGVESPIPGSKKMEKSEDVKKLEVAQAPASAPAAEQPTAPQPPAPPIPKEIVETPKPAPVPSGGQENALTGLLNNPEKLKKMSWKDFDKRIGRTK